MTATPSGESAEMLSARMLSLAASTSATENPPASAT